MTQFNQINALQPFPQFEIEGDVLAIMLVRADHDDVVIGYRPTLAKWVVNDIWDTVGPTRSAVWQGEFSDHHHTPEDWARSDVAAWNLWLADTYGEDADLSAFERWVKAMNDYYRTLKLEGNQLKHPGGDS